MTESAMQLTADGARALRSDRSSHDDSDPPPPLLLQVADVYRYLADPALTQLLGDAAGGALDRDVFDVVLSDGQLKTKCVLSPALNHLVWRGQVQRHDILLITDYQVFQVDDDDDGTPRPVCFIKNFEVFAPRKSGTSLITSAPPKLSALNEKDVDDGALAFASTAHKREFELMPLAGEREYYLPLNSDHHELHWAKNAAARAQQKRQYCPDPFASGTRVIHEIDDIFQIARGSKVTASGISRAQFPPMIGVVRVKSRVTHFGEPGIANPFPFVFHIILVDRDSAVEVAFFGSMCAKYFAVIEEGDLIQICGYAVSISKTDDESEDAGSADEQLYFFEHESQGQVFHVPAKFWKVLQMLRILDKPAPKSGGDSSIVKKSLTSSAAQPPLPPIWLQCSFATTLEAQYWKSDVLKVRDRFYFDFVGVLTFVGRICRRRKRKRVSGDSDDDSDDEKSDTAAAAVAHEENGPLTEYRWVKAVDRSSSTELVILMGDCSLPQQFRDLKAGDVVMLTKLKWVVEDHTHLDVETGVDDHVFGARYAICSSFTVTRVNDAVVPFNGVEECSLNSYFAKKLVANGRVREQSATGESWLESDTIKQYRTLAASGTQTAAGGDLGDLSPPLGRHVYQFSELSGVCDKLEKLEHRHVAVVGRLLSVPAIQADGNDDVDVDHGADYEIEIGDSHDSELSRKALLRANPVFRVLGEPSSAEQLSSQEEVSVDARDSILKETQSKSVMYLLKMLAPSIVDEILADASKGIGLKRKRKKHKKKQPLTNYPSRGGHASESSGSSNAPVRRVAAPGTAAATASVATGPRVLTTHLTLAFLKKRLTRSNRLFLFSTHLYRTEDGKIDVEVDAVLPYALDV